MSSSLCSIASNRLSSARFSSRRSDAMSKIMAKLRITQVKINGLLSPRLFIQSKKPLTIYLPIASITASEIIGGRVNCSKAKTPATVITTVASCIFHRVAVSSFLSNFISCLVAKFIRYVLKNSMSVIETPIATTQIAPSLSISSFFKSFISCLVAKFISTASVKPVVKALAWFSGIPASLSVSKYLSVSKGTADIRNPSHVF